MVRLEKRYLRKDGSVVWVKFSMTVERDALGKPLYEIAVYDDITAQREAEARLKESEARFRQTFELAASGICHVSDGRFVRVNRSLCEILGYPEKELLGKTVKEVSHPDDRDVTDAERARIRAGEIDSARFEKRYLREDGAVVWCDIAIALVRDVFGMPLYEIAVFDDITERKDAEAALRAAHQELKRSNAELEQFAYVASHDLQEPLRMVASYTQLLSRRYDSKFDKDAREFMAYIVDGATRMKQLIEDLLAYSRVGTKGQEFQPVPLEAPLRRALFNLRAGIEEAGAAVTYDPLPTVSGDEVQLGQLLQNLIGNALKFRSNSVPRIHVGVAGQAPRIPDRSARQRHRHRAAVLRAHLHGVPAPVQQGRVSRHRHRARHLQEGGRAPRRAHLGRVAPGSGCEPGLELLLHAAETRGRADGREKRPIEILLVEDNPGDVRLTKEALKEGKVYSNLHTCKDGVEAMDSCGARAGSRTRRAPTSSCSTSTCRARTGARCWRRSSRTRC